MTKTHQIFTLLASTSMVCACGGEETPKKVETPKEVAALAQPVASAGPFDRLYVPQDADPMGCDFSQTNIAKAVNASSFDGFVAAPNSLGTQFEPNIATTCDFYVWSIDMFANLTSPWGNGTRVFNSSSFFDVSPQDSDGNRVLLETDGMLNLSARTAKANESGRFTLSAGEDVEEVGQAGSLGVLISNTGSITYYGIHTNDVYANFLANYVQDLQNNAPTATSFPISSEDMQPVCSYSDLDAGVPMADPNMLMLELKTSWVDATTLENPGDYITMAATLPNYTEVKNSDGSFQKYQLDGTKRGEVALVGMHVVGSVNSHPELVWASFEHVSNAPDDTYYYNSTTASQNPVKVSRPSSGSYLFSEFSGSTTFNVKNLQADLDGEKTTGNIVPASGVTDPLAKTVALRNNPWGQPGGTDARANEATAIKENSIVISLNAAMQQAFASKEDVRANYVMIGSLWTSYGNVPDAPGVTAHFTGGIQAANATMETFTQDTASAPGKGCFNCHTYYAGANDGNISVSHIFDHLYTSSDPLPASLRAAFRPVKAGSPNVCADIESR